jgi:hypothetical protein
MNQFIDFQADHEAQLASIANKRDQRVAVGEAMVTAAKEDYQAEQQRAERAHADAIHERLVTFQRRSAEVLDPAVAAYVDSPDRKTVAALADALIQVEGDAFAECGLTLDRNGGGCGVELLHAFIATRLESASPEAAQRLAFDGNGHISGLSTHYRLAVEALRQRDLPSASTHLLNVEAALSAVAREGSRGAGDGTERFAIVRFGGRERRQAALRDLEKTAFERQNGNDAERQIRSSAMHYAIAQREIGEAVDAAYVRMMAELGARAKQAVAVVADVLDPPPASPRKPKPRSSSDDAVGPIVVNDGPLAI